MPMKSFLIGRFLVRHAGIRRTSPVPLVGVVEKVAVESPKVVVMAALEVLRDQGLLSTSFSLFRRGDRFWDQRL